MAQNIRLTLLNDAVICLLDQRFFCMIKKQCYLMLKERFEWNLFQVLLSLLPIIDSSASCNLKKQPLEVFCKEKCCQKFCKIHRKTLCQSLSSLSRVSAALGLQLYFKKILLRRYFLMNLAKFLRAPFFQNPSRWLLLYLQKILKFKDSSQRHTQSPVKHLRWRYL